MEVRWTPLPLRLEGLQRAGLEASPLGINFTGVGRSHMSPKIFADRAKRGEIQSCLRKAQAFVWTAPDLVSGAIVLAIILPKTNWANLEVT